MPKATVIKTYPGRALIMTENCEFKEIKTNQPLQIGEELEYDESRILNDRKAIKALALAACLAVLCLLAYALVGPLPTQNIYACIDLEINPSLELSLNRNLRVIESRSFDQEGKIILTIIKPEGKKLETVIPAVVREAKKAGYLREGPNIIGVGLSMYSEPETSLQFLNQLEKQLAPELTAARSQATVYYFVIDKTTRDRALKNQSSPVFYYLHQKAKKQGFSVPQGNMNLHDPAFAGVAAKNAAKVSRHLPAPLDEKKMDRPGQSKKSSKPVGTNKERAAPKIQSGKNQGNPAQVPVMKARRFRQGSDS